MKKRPRSKPVFLDPTIDWAFKRIFGSLESHDILVGFLNDLLLHAGQPVIQSLTIKDPYLPARLKDLKETAVDVRAVLSDGTEKLIEMQLFPTSGFTQRLNYNAAKVMAGQLRRGGNYLNVRPVTVIAITNFVILPHRGRNGSATSVRANGRRARITPTAESISFSWNSPKPRRTTFRRTTRCANG